jgi:peptidoglycan-N-acetylglucosamine deacetylase
MSRRLACVSVDLDPLACYYRIHALGPLPEGSSSVGGLADVVMRRSVPRFLDIFARHGVRATFFVVGSDVDGGSLGAQAARGLVREMIAAGHEVANHSFSHPYDLARLPARAVAEEIRRADGAIAAAAGAAVVGFRAPGYDLSATMLDVVAGLGYLYDSSLFPAPGYYAAKAVVMAGLRLVGRKSGAVMTDPRALIAPTDPYRPSATQPWRRGQSTVVELPIAVTPFLRLPAIGTNLLLFPTALRAAWLASMRARPLFNLELHGIDLCDAEADGLPRDLVARQPDLRASLAAKARAFEATLDRLAPEYDFIPLREAAKEVQREGRLK